MNLLRILLNLRIAQRSLATFKLRTALAILGVFLGTFSLVVVSGLTRSMALKTQQEVAALGENLLIVQSGIVRTFGNRARLMNQATTLTLEDARAILESTPSVTHVSPSSGKTFPVRYGSLLLKDVMVTGATPNYPLVRNFHPERGRFLTPDDERNLRRVAVLGRKIADTIFPGTDPLGKIVLLWRVPCRVVGVMEPKGSDVSGFDQDNQIFVPLSTFLKRFTHQTYVSTVYVKVIREEALAATKRNLEDLLRTRHGIEPGERDDFTVVDLRDVMSLKNQAMDMISLLGRIAAAVSFAIGGLGILSIMILMVNERRLEIGLRRAVGSRRRDVVTQFLLESSVIALAGGILGAVLGLAASLALFHLLGYPLVASWPGLILGFGASISVGILAGIYPSQRALAIQPVDVMRT
ncbi:putative ABC transport system permease protein [Desulfacinum hydrothermale DSM 13146]|uniref:Putative ABC transport system permease protein n=1 Tax=Desulfacinum hydrothermale DSM 13146 TaxID=1121390 RepID=A0A1W1XDM6_9BACT|nr:ABC transporter permease [Desulfacinum hydrothermale]SMC21980.1 putative ABC transport system permease protein [Desulfacinum hydrothermale DSM 13146]